MPLTLKPASRPYSLNTFTTEIGNLVLWCFARAQIKQFPLRWRLKKSKKREQKGRRRSFELGPSVERIYGKVGTGRVDDPASSSHVDDDDS